MPSPNRNNLRLSGLRAAARVLSPYVKSSSAPPRRVLILRPDHVGDVLLSAPAVALLRQSLPRAELTYLVGPWSEAAARHGPAVDRIETLEFPGFTRRHKVNAVQPYLALAQVAARLRSQAYDVAVVLRPDHWWGALLALSAGIPVRVGSRGPETTPLLTHARSSGPGEHWAEQALAVARLALVATRSDVVESGEVPQFHLDDAAQAAAAEFWRQAGLDGKPVVALHPSAGAPLKSWPAANWARLADGLFEDGVSVLLVGAPSDRPLIEAIGARMAHLSARACGQTLSVSAAIYARCRLVITVDSGAGHLAGAVGAPTIRLYGPAPPDVFGPWPARVDQQVLMTRRLSCVPCGHLVSPPCGATAQPACMLALQVEAVLNAARLSLEQG